MTQAVVIRPHQPKPGTPLRLKAGETVQLDEYDTEYPEWLWVVAPDGTGGWIHESLISRAGDKVTAACDYDATELAVATGEKVEVLQELGGWVQCRNSTGEVGWVPRANVSAETQGS